MAILELVLESRISKIKTFVTDQTIGFIYCCECQATLTHFNYRTVCVFFVFVCMGFECYFTVLTCNPNTVELLESGGTV